MRRVHKHANGIPRLVNVIAERALLAGYARDAATIDPKLVDAAAREVLPARNAIGGACRRRGCWRRQESCCRTGRLGCMACAARDEDRRGRDAAPIESLRPSPPRKPRFHAPTPLRSPRQSMPRVRRRTGVLLGAWAPPASAITVDPASAACTAAVADVHCVQGSARLTRCRRWIVRCR